MNVDPEALSATASTNQHDDSGLPYRLGVLGERVPAPAPWPPTGQNSSRLHWGALPRHGVAQPPAARSSEAHSSTRPVPGRLGSAPRPAAGEHERSPILVTRRSEQNVKILSEPLMQRAFYLSRASILSRTRFYLCLLYTSPSPRDKRQSRMPSSA